MRIHSKLQYFILILSIAYIFRLILAHNLSEFTVINDLGTFHAWGINLAENGSRNFYTGWSDYSPGYLYVLWGLAILEKWLLLHSLPIQWEILYKIPSILTDLANTVFIYLIAQKFISSKKALLAAVFFLFNPAIFANSTLWGQADSFMTLFLLSSLYYLLQKKIWLSALLLGLGQIVKPIALFSLPIYLLYMLMTKTSMRLIIIYVLIFMSVIILAFIPFNSTDNLFNFIIERHLVTANQYPYTSVNAFNFWSIITKLWAPDNSIFLGFTLHTWGYILFGLLYLILLLIIIKNRIIANLSLILSFSLMLCYFGMFILLTRMHERHIFYGLSYLSLLLPTMPISGIILTITLFLVHLVNLYYPYSQATPNPLTLPQNVIIFLSVISVFVFLYFLVLFLSKYAKIK